MSNNDGSMKTLNLPSSTNTLAKKDDFKFIYSKEVDVASAFKNIPINQNMQRRKKQDTSGISPEMK